MTINIIAIPFSYVGASWFAHLSTTKSGRLVGMRWQHGSAWGNIVTAPPIPEGFDRVPKVAKPRPPTAAEVQEREARRRS